MRTHSHADANCARDWYTSTNRTHAKTRRTIPVYRLRPGKTRTMQTSSNLTSRTMNLQPAPSSSYTRTSTSSGISSDTRTNTTSTSTSTVTQDESQDTRTSTGTPNDAGPRDEKDPSTSTSTCTSTNTDTVGAHNLLNYANYIRTVTRLATGKVPGPGGIPNDVLRYLPDRMHSNIFGLFLLLAKHSYTRHHGAEMSLASSSNMGPTL